MGYNARNYEIRDNIARMPFQCRAFDKGQGMVLA
jgi:hypothetical protein